jgi:hypothetical protein
VTVSGARIRARIKPSLPWLILAGALVLATMPAWRPLVFGVTPTLEDLLNLRCPPP